MTETPSISVCVAVYRQHGAPNLQTLADRIATAGTTIELVVALNGISADVAQAPTWARLVDLKVNRGVAPGWNAAARASTGNVLVFANDDALPAPHTFALLADVLSSNPATGVVGPASHRWNINTGNSLNAVSTAGLPLGTLVETEVVSGFFMACRRSVYDTVGGFDEFYAPASWEEIDFCCAVRAQGLRNYVVAGADVQHKYGISRRQVPWKRIRFNGTSESLRSIHRRNRAHFLSKWADVPFAPVGE